MPAVRVQFNRFAELSAALSETVSKAVQRVATEIEQDVKGGPHAAPYRTGNLRRSYHTKRVGKYEVQVGNDPSIAYYALFVEFGTVKMAPRPHLRPAAEAAGQRFGAQIAEAMGHVR